MNVYVLSTVGIGIDIISILKQQLDIKGVIGLSKREPSAAISDYVYLRGFCGVNKLAFLPVRSYGLDDPRDQKLLLRLDIDILVVAGWQRLVPDWLIRHCKIAVIGCHGSPWKISGGRGRSPQNWALLLGKKEFYISIFKIDAGIDSGGVYDTQKYVLSDFDDIKTSYYKVSWLMAHMVIKNIKNGNILKNAVKKQRDDPYYLPQRLPEDGEIDWNRSTREIYDFIRALSRPYPGAFSKIRNQISRFWASMPFEIISDRDYKSGELVKIFNNKDLLIKTGDGFILITDHTIDREGPGHDLREGEVFASCDFTRQIRGIIKRHQRRYPGLKITKDVVALSVRQHT